MEYQQKLIILPAVQDMKNVLNITAHEAVGTGLCYHAVGGDEKDGWILTHIRSKKALCMPIGTEYEVKLLLEKVASIADWNQDEKELTRPEIGIEFRECQQTIKQELNMQLETVMKDSDMPDYLVEDVMEIIGDEECPTIRNALLHAFKIITPKLDS